MLPSALRCSPTICKHSLWVLQWSCCSSQHQLSSAQLQVLTIKKMGAFLLDGLWMKNIFLHPFLLVQNGLLRKCSRESIRHISSS